MNSDHHLRLCIIQPELQSGDERFQSGEANELLKAYEEFYPKSGFNPPWVGYYIERGSEVVGSCGFTGKPKDGKVELAYWTFNAFQGNGIASFACSELISIARAADKEITITAKTAPENNASTRILEKAGFTRKGIVQDHEIGDAWYWEL